MTRRTTKFEFDGYSKKEQLDVLDMKCQMDMIGEALNDGNAEKAEFVYEYLSGKQEEYWNSGYDNYEIITCQDFAYDSMQALKSCDKQGVEALRRRYNKMYGGENGQ